MGKQSKGGKGNGSSGAATAAKKCTCDHPYECKCGNRPSRPSKGHKWYPEEQVWAGKGHKQKGASGQTASMGEAVMVTAKGQTSVAQWQRLPSQLLKEYCQRQKRPLPKYKNIEKSNGKFKYRVILSDPKGDDHKDLFFVPPTAVQNEEQAQEEGALLALLQLTPSLPHERKLPEPYKTSWLNAVCDSKKILSLAMKEVTQNNSDKTSSNLTAASAPTAAIASTNLALGLRTSTAEQRRQREEKRQRRIARIRRHDAIRLANQNHPVFMSARLRQQIQALLRSAAESSYQSCDFKESDPAGADNNDDDNDFDDDQNVNDAQASVEHRLQSEGFTKRQARMSYQSWSSTSSMNEKQQMENEDTWDSVYEQCLQWLLLHLNEDQLPEGFDPRGRTLDVIMPVANSAEIDPLKAEDGTNSSIIHNNDNNGATVTSPYIDLAAQLGISVKEAKLIYELSNQDTSTIVSPLDIFWQTIQKVHAVAGTDGEAVLTNVTSAVLTTDETATAKELLQEECEALLAIFGDECKVDKTDEIVTVIRLPLETGNFSLEVLVRDGVYPHAPPLRVLVTGQSWPFRMGAELHVALYRFLLDLPLGEPMIFALHAEIQDLLLVTPKDSATLSLFTFLSGGNSVGDRASRDALAAPFSTRAQKAQVKEREEFSSDRVAALGASIPRRRPRPQRRNFWTISPKETPPAAAMPTVSVAMKATRDALPAARRRDEFLSIMNRAINVGSRVMLVTGETGSGKSTQLPAYILENDPEGAKIVVAQPRRLAATGLASRVAEERGESQVGQDSVGYVVRGDSAMSLRTRLVFCTTGVLLRQLQNEGALDCVTHIVVDEVHERQLDSDVLLGFLRKSLHVFPNLFVVLMSATMDSERFARYWGSDTPHVHLPGRTFPVADFMLEDVLVMTGYVPPPRKQRGGKTKGNRRNKQRKVSPWNDSEVSDCDEDDKVESGEEKMLEHGRVGNAASNIPLESLLERIEETILDPDLICCLVRHIVRNQTTKHNGSILVFLPGVQEIMSTIETIRRGTKDLALVLLPLHGGLQPKEQCGIFQPAPNGYTKVVCSTNVAETSITIPDCTAVIDCCREKQSSYDPINRMPLLVEHFASKASLKQRRGRAGRVREGVCFKLISRNTLFGLKDHSDPEIWRVALDQMLLQLLFLGAETGAGDFMQTLLDPPSRESFEAAVFSLTKLGAVEKGASEGEIQVTPLGNHIAGIPAPPIVGKMLVMGAILGCRSAALGMAAGISFGRSPFMRIDDYRHSRGKNNEEMSIEDVKCQRTLEERSKYFKMVGYSDHAVLAALLLKWNETGAGGGNRKTFCDSVGLSFTAMRDIQQLALQMDGSLKAAGFVPTPESDRNSKSWRIIRACAVSAMAPSHLVKIRRPAAKYLDTAEGARAKDSEAKELMLLIRTENAQEERVFIHPSSANFSNGNYSCPFLVYNSLVRTSKPFLRDVTECSAYSLLLFGGILEVKASKGTITVDGWVELSANARIGTLIGGLRIRLDKLMAEKAKDPSFNIAGSKEMQLIVKLIASEGLG